YVARMTTAAEKLGAAADRSADEDVLRVLLANEGEFLTRMDRIVGLYEDEARGRAARLLWIGWIVTALIIIAFAAIGRFVLMPATRVIEGQIADLRAVRDYLEERVQERTAELTRAAAELEAEHRERIVAEERHRHLLEQFS